MATAVTSAPRQKVPASRTPGTVPGVSPDPGMIALRAAFGQDEANHGTARFRVDNDGVVWVPLEAAASLISKGGFAVAKLGTASPAAALCEIPVRLMTSAQAQSGREAGLVRLHHDNAAGCSYDGCSYPRDCNGDVLVPAEATSDLEAHGFVPLTRPPLATAEIAASPHRLGSGVSLRREAASVRRPPRPVSSTSIGKG
jgi:hypothetical protein